MWCCLYKKRQFETPYKRQTSYEAAPRFNWENHYFWRLIIKWRQLVTVQCNKNQNYVKYLTTEREKIVRSSTLLSSIECKIAYFTILSCHSTHLMCFVLLFRKREEKQHFFYQIIFRTYVNFWRKLIIFKNFNSEEPKSVLFRKHRCQNTFFSVSVKEKGRVSKPLQ